MATKVNAKPALDATKDEFVCVDRKVYKSSVWQYFGWHKKAIGSVKTRDKYLEHVVPHQIRVWNKGNPARVSVYGIIDLQLYCMWIRFYVYSCKKEEMGSSCSTNTGSATTSVKGARSMDKFVQPVTVMKGEKLDRANELLVNALTANLMPSALLDSPEFRDLLGFISSGAYIHPSS